MAETTLVTHSGAQGLSKFLTLTILDFGSEELVIVACVVRMLDVCPDACSCYQKFLQGHPIPTISKSENPDPEQIQTHGPRYLA